MVLADWLDSIAKPAVISGGLPSMWCVIWNKIAFLGGCVLSVYNRPKYKNPALPQGIFDSRPITSDYQTLKLLEPPDPYSIYIMSDQEFYSTGRGGAGNISHGKKPSEPTYVEEGAIVPELKQQIYTTGRGGAGNMRLNDDKEITRKLQDVEGPVGRVSAENPSFSGVSVGRGGYGNVMATKEAQDAEKQSFLQRVKAFFGSSESTPKAHDGDPSSSK